jgi:hypothetical protein
MKDISKVHTINTHIQRLGHKGSYRLDDTLRLFNSSVGCGEWKRTPAIQSRIAPPPRQAGAAHFPPHEQKRSTRKPHNGLRFTRAASVNRESIFADSDEQNRYDLIDAQRRRVEALVRRRSF